MEDFITLCHWTTCYHCHKDVNQIITAVPNAAQVVCDNCGATRSYVPIIEDIRKKGDYVKPGCYDTWNLMSTALCRQCRVAGPHDVTVRCRNCGFTHLYLFNLELIDDPGGPQDHLEINREHGKGDPGLPPGMVIVDLDIETRGPDYVQEIKQKIR